MSKINNYIFTFFTSLFFIIITLFHTRLLGIENFFVSGNYEFFKVFLINTFFVWLFIISYFLVLKKFRIEKNIFFILGIIFGILSISTLVSQIPYNSLFGGVSKGHGYFFFISLMLIFLFFYFGIQKYGKKIYERLFLIIGLLLVFIGYKELFFPSFDYGVLGSRMLSTFGHPNYVAGFLTLLFPYIYFENKKYYSQENSVKKYIYLMIFIIIVSGIILTQSAIAIGIIVSFLVLNFGKGKNIEKILFLLFIFSLGFIILFIFSPEKFSSFISRYYIWETSLKIIFSDIKIFFFGIGNENLTYFFDIFKSPELYLYERFGYSASRAHNIFIDMWLNYGIIGLGLLSALFYKTIQNINRNIWYFHSLLFGFIFYFFHFPNTFGYIFVVFLLSLWTIQSRQEDTQYIQKKYQHLFIILLTIIAGIGSYFSYNFYQAERFAYKDQFSSAIKTFPYYGNYYLKNGDLEKALETFHQFEIERYLLYKIYYSSNYIDSCNNLLEKYPSVENYFYCGEKIEKAYGLLEAKPYYQKGLDKFPDIFSQNNKYLNNFPGKYIINKQNIVSPKFSNIQEIINKMQ